jgi:flagellar export protein FliJ
VNGTDTSQLELARTVVQAREQRLAVEVEELIRQRTGAERTLTRLGAYLDEYAAADRGRATRTQSPRNLVNGRHFVQRLGVAISQQKISAERLAERASIKVSQWQRVRAELAAIERVIDTRRRSARRLEERRAQRETDAHAARRADTLARHGDPDPQATTPTRIRSE